MRLNPWCDGSEDASMSPLIAASQEGVLSETRTEGYAVARFAMVEVATYLDGAYRDLSTDARLLFIWSWTNPESSICGLYRVSMKSLRRALSEEPIASEQRVRLALTELAHKPLVRYDEDNEVIWVTTRVRYANRSPKVVTAMRREVQACPPSPLLAGFIAMYGKTLGIDLLED